MVILPTIRRSWFKLVKVCFGGQTVTLGNFTFLMGSVSIVVVTGFSFHDLKELKIRKPDPENPNTTTTLHRNLE